MIQSFLSERVKSLIHLDPRYPPIYSISNTSIPHISKIREGHPLLGIYSFCIDADAYVKENESQINIEGFGWLLYPVEWNNLCSKIYEEVDVREILLWMTMDFERSLGNILYSIRVQIPHLLKDILKNAVLKETIGEVNGEILFSLMGSPETLNIRNLLWHGFVSKNELHSAYVSALIIVAQSIGHVLSNKGFQLCKRHFSLNLDRCSYFPSPLLSNLDISSHADPMAQRVLNLCKEGNMSLSLILFLPYLELNLRFVFTLVNNCPQRLLTAESDQFYTTFEEIFAPEISTTNGSYEANKLREHIGDSLLEFYYDIFIFPDGPRVRDRLSHGEFRIFKEADEAFDAPLNLLLRSFFLPKDFDSYRSIFHPFSLLFRKVSEATDEVLQSGSPHLLSSLPCSTNEYSCLFRPKREIQIVRILNQIAEAIKVSAVSMNENRSLTIAKMKSKSLRSRSRLTAERMLSGIKNLQVSQLEILTYLLLVFASRENPNIDLKNLKKILSLVQNISTWVKVNENRWDRVESANESLKNLMSNVCFNTSDK